MELYRILTDIFSKVTNGHIENIYDSTQQVFSNGFFHTTMLIITLAWIVIKIAKTEQFSLKDVYPIMIWLLCFYTAFLIVRNKDIYFEVLEIFNLPRNCLTWIFSQTPSEHPADIIKSLYTGLNATQEALDEADGSWYSFNIIDKTISIIFFLSTLVLIAVLAFTLIFSSLVAKIILSFGAFMFVCLIWNKTRGYFFSWLKLYLSFSFYAPLGVLIGSIALAFGDYASNVAVTIGEKQSMDLQGMIIVIVGLWMCIYLFTKIPMIVNGIVGSANDSSTGGSGLVGFVAGMMGAGLSKLTDYFKGKGSEGIGKLSDLFKRDKDKGGDNSGGQQNTIDSDTTHN